MGLACLFETYHIEVAWFVLRIACHRTEFEYVGQIGNPSIDHSFWGRPEVWQIPKHWLGCSHTILLCQRMTMPTNKWQRIRSPQPCMTDANAAFMLDHHHEAHTIYLPTTAACINMSPSVPCCPLFCPAFAFLGSLPYLLFFFPSPYGHSRPGALAPFVQS